MGLFDFFSKKREPLSDNEMLAKLRPVIADILGCDEEEVVPQAYLGNDLGCDELDFLDVLETIEQKRHFKIPRSEEKNIRTVGDIIRVIRKYNRV